MIFLVFFSAAVVAILFGLDPPWVLPGPEDSWVWWAFQRVLDLAVLLAAGTLALLPFVERARRARGEAPIDWGEPSRLVRGLSLSLWGFAAVAVKLVTVMAVRIVGAGVAMIREDGGLFPGVLFLGFFALVGVGLLGGLAFILWKMQRSRRALDDRGIEVVVGTVVRKTVLPPSEAVAHRAGELSSYEFELDSGRVFWNVGRLIYDRVELGAVIEISVLPVLGEILRVQTRQSGSGSP